MQIAINECSARSRDANGNVRDPSPPAHGPSRVELPASDVDRAQSFYRALLGLYHTDERGLPIVFQHRSEQERNAERFSSAPARLQLQGLSSLERALDVAWERGGRIVKCARRIGRGTWSATIVDSEGNLVSLYAPS